VKKFKIEHYDFGEMIVNGKEYRHDLIITPDRIIDNWWRIEGHRLQLADLQDLEGVDFEYLVIGTGYSGLMRVDPEVIDAFERRGVKVLVYNTREAVRKYNELVEKGKKVVGAFHLTC